MSEAQLRRALTLLWMCGLPGHGPGDLIDLSFEGDTVSVIFDAGMSRPLRLTGEEALALVVALRTLAETHGLADTDAVQRALARVESVAGAQSTTRRSRSNSITPSGCCPSCRRPRLPARRASISARSDDSWFAYWLKTSSSTRQ